jgi:hypothetical protein
MTTLLPLDADNNPIQAMRLRDGGAHSIAATATSARNTTAFSTETKVISLYATGPVYVRLGGASVTASASDHYFPAGTYYDVAITGGRGSAGLDTHIAVLRANADCTLYVSEKQ